MSDDLTDFLVRAIIFLSTLIMLPMVFGGIESEILEEAVSRIFDVLPSIFAIGAFIWVVNILVEQSDIHPSEWDYNFKIWEWSLKKYIACSISAIIMVRIINPALAFIVSLILFVVSLYRISLRYKKERA